MFNPIHVKSDKSFDPESGKYKLEIILFHLKILIYLDLNFMKIRGAVRLMFPHEARLRDFTYACNMVIDMTVKYIIRSGVHLNSEETMYKTFSKIQLGKLPVMLKSCLCVLHQYSHVPSAMIGECSLDAGGYLSSMVTEKRSLVKNDPTEISFNVLILRKTIQNGVGVQKSNQYQIINLFHRNKIIFIL